MRGENGRGQINTEEKSEEEREKRKRGEENKIDGQSGRKRKKNTEKS